MEIRIADSNDAPAISALIQHTIRTSNSTDYPPEDIELTCVNFSEAKVVEKMQRRDVFVALGDSTLVGTVSLEGGILHSLFVLPEQQGNGIGRSLVLHVENLAFSRGVSEMVTTSSLTAKDFHQRLGYAEVAFEERPFGSTWLMKKALP